MSVKDERAERLATRLRENLRRRKAQARAIRSGEVEDATPPKREDGEEPRD